MKLRHARRLWVVGLFLIGYLIMLNIPASLFKDGLSETGGFATNTPQSQPSASGIFSGVNSPQNITEAGQGSFTENQLNVTRADNLSVSIPKDWTARKIQTNVTSLSEYNRAWVNDSFDSGYDNTYWKNQTTVLSPANNRIEGAWEESVSSSNDSIYLRFVGDNSADFTGETLWNNSHYIARPHIPYSQWQISLRFRLLETSNDWRSEGPYGGSNVICRVQTGATAIDFNLMKPADVANNTWYVSNIAPFAPELYGFSLQKQVSILVGVNWKASFIPAGNVSFYFDYVTFKLSTYPLPEEIALNLTDQAHITKQSFTGTEYGKGSTLFQDEWEGGSSGQQYNFTFESNSTGTVILDSAAYIDASSQKFTATELGITGAEFSLNNNTNATWTMYFSVDIPGTYSTGYQFNMTKPINWNVTHVFDPFGTDRLESVLATSGYGSDTLVLPNNIMTNGRWKIVADGPNYITMTSTWNGTGSDWQENAHFYIGDVIKINGTVSEDLVDLSQTNATLTVTYPNGTVWADATQNATPSIGTGVYEFSPIEIGDRNASAGQYSIEIQWIDGINTQAGYYELGFDIEHRTSLARADDQVLEIECFTGDVISFKVNYSDTDWGEGIFGATANFTVNTSLPVTGEMIYFGGGVYFAQVDTIAFAHGRYNISVSANKSYYGVQTGSALIYLHVTESTTFNCLQTGFVDVGWSTNFTLDFVYNNSLDQGIPDAIIDAEWDADYVSCFSDYLGLYHLTFNTSLKVAGTYYFKVNASKTGFQTRQALISLNIRNIFTNITKTQPEQVGFKQNVSIEVQYGDTDSHCLIPEAEITVSSGVGENYWSLDQYLVEILAVPGTYNITINTTLFGNIGTFIIYVTARKTNYANATTSVTIFVGKNPAQLILTPIDGAITTYLNKIQILSVQYRDLAGNIIPNAQVNYSESSLGIGGFTHVGGGVYNVSINTNSLGIGLFYITVQANGSADAFESYTDLFTLEVKPIPTLLTPEPASVEIDPQAQFSIKCTFAIDAAIFGTSGTISGAEVSYFWSRGEGVLTDNGDGTFGIQLEAPLNPGVYKITITAMKANYDVTTIVIDVVVKAPDTGNLMPLIIALTTGLVGFAVVFLAYLLYFRYPAVVRKIRKVRGSMKKGGTTKISSHPKKRIFVENLLKEHGSNIPPEARTKLKTQYLQLEKEEPLDRKIPEEFSPKTIVVQELEPAKAPPTEKAVPKPSPKPAPKPAAKAFEKPQQVDFGKKPEVKTLPSQKPEKESAKPVGKISLEEQINKIEQEAKKPTKESQDSNNKE